MFKRLLITIYLSFSFVLSFSLNVTAFEMMDKTVAIVKDTVILESEIEQRIRQILSNNPEFVMDQNTQSEVLDQLILEELQLDIAKRINLNVDESQVERTLINIKRSVASKGLSFENYLAQQGLTESELKQSIRREVIIRRVQEGTINRRIRITEREIDEFLESAQGKAWLKPRYHLSHILLPIPETVVDDAPMLQQAQKLHQLLNKPGTNFATIAQAYSGGPNAEKGGDLGWREKDQIPPLFLNQVAALKPGDITSPFRSGAGIHILKVVDRSGAEPVMVKRYKVRHILIKSTALYTDAEAKAKIDSLYNELESGANFIDLAKEYNEDTGSKNSGGDLGWSTPGTFVPEFENTMENTPVGNYSRPFRTQFGWHILKVEDSRIEDMFETVKRNQVVKILRQRRFGDELELWFQELREDNFVEVLL